jgi:WhiB family transcriptional regulator, redox-sensing transcriptional regulator
MNMPERAAPAGADWRSQSACRDTDPELFFPLSAWGPGQAQIASAKAICAHCEVRSDCLQFALSSGQEFGIWGGTSEDERRAMRRAQLVLKPRPVTEPVKLSRRRNAAQPVRLAEPGQLASPVRPAHTVGGWCSKLAELPSARSVRVSARGVPGQARSRIVAAVIKQNPARRP